MGNILSGLFGGSAPTVSAAPVATTTAAKRKAKRSRVQVLETAGGITGEELDPGSVGAIDNIFGN